jgi:protein-S-isoprenylcysteine O-methyltransferase Ste14
MNTPVIIAGTIIIITFSWFFSIRHKRYHGIFRFFSFESIFLLLYMNYRNWFSEPFTPVHLLSWIFLFASLYPGIAGYLLLRNKGRSEVSFENTTVLVKSGIYKYIRHPLYCSLLLLGTGIMLKDLKQLQLILGTVNAAAIFLTALTEEKEMMTKFSDDYRIYMKETKMFIPFVI